MRRALRNNYLLAALITATAFAASCKNDSEDQAGTTKVKNVLKYGDLLHEAVHRKTEKNKSGDRHDHDKATIIITIKSDAKSGDHEHSKFMKEYEGMHPVHCVVDKIEVSVNDGEFETLDPDEYSPGGSRLVDNCI